MPSNGKLPRKGIMDAVKEVHTLVRRKNPLDPVDTQGVNIRPNRKTR